MFMDNEHMFALSQVGIDTANRTDEVSGRPGNEAIQRIGAALGELRQVRIGPMSRDEADHALGMLGQMQSMATSLMCDVTQQGAGTHSDTDPAEMLRQGGRLPSRESKRMAKIAKQLSDMPKVKERFATGEITPGHVNALTNAAEKVGPEAVDTDETLLEAADQMLPDSFDRHAREVVRPEADRSRPRPARASASGARGQAVGGEGHRARSADGQAPGPQFEQLRQAVDNHYMHHLRRDGADGRSSDEVRTPKQHLADVVFELVTNRNAFTGEFITETFGIKAKATIQLVLVAPVGAVDGTNPSGYQAQPRAGPSCP